MGVQGNKSLLGLLEQDHPERLAKAALLLTREVQPSLDIHAYLQRLRRYAEAISERLSPSAGLGDVLFHLNDYLFNDCGFSSDSSHPRSAELNYLHRVIDKHCGTPLCMAIIYLTVGRWLGLPLQGMFFPGRILVAYQDAQGEVVMDPSYGGLSLQEEDLVALLSRTYALDRVPSYQLKRFFAASDDKSLLVRMLRQLKQAYLSQGKLENALWALQKLLELVPEQASGFRERGYLYELLDCSYAAAMDYTHYLELLPDASDAAFLRKRLPTLLRTPVTLH